jgi:predicted naringenin-chalcone synthase
VEQLLADARLAPGDLHTSCLVALHPSGEGLLRGSAAALGLEPCHAAASRAVLGTRGNPSGAGTLMALGLGIEAVAAAGAPGGPSHAVAVALGPGPSAEGLVLRLRL